MLVLTSATVERLMPAAIWVDLVAQAYISFSAQSAVSPLRSRISLLPFYEGRTAFMPGYVGDAEALGCKVVGYYPGNSRRGLSAVEGVVMLIDPETGAPLALLDGTRLTELRTGAIVAAGVRHLATQSAISIGLFGTGALARASVHMLRETCGLESVFVFSRSRSRREAFAREVAESYGVQVTVCHSPQEVLAAATIIICATATQDPVFPGSALRKDSFVISIGANTPDTRELDEETMRASTLVVESREATLAECGEVAIPIRAGRLGPDVIEAEIGEIIAGTKSMPVEGRPLVFKSTGLAVQDLVIARELVRRAEKAGEGERIQLKAEF